MRPHRRLERLENQQLDDDGPRIDWGALARGELIVWPERDEAEVRDEIEKDRIAIMIRQEYDRLKIPQPESLEGVDLIEEVIRLAGIPDSAG